MENFWRYKGLIKLLDSWVGVGVGLALVALCFFAFVMINSKKIGIVFKVIGIIIAIPTLLNAFLNFGDEMFIPDVDQHFYNIAKESVDDTDGFLNNEITLQELVNKLELTSDKISERYDDLPQPNQAEQDIDAVFVELLFGVVQVYQDYQSTPDVKVEDLDEESIEFIIYYRDQLNGYLGLG